MKKVITVVGHTAYDYIFNVTHHPSINHSAYITEWKKCYGGGAANIAVGIAKLGGKSRLYTIMGKDCKRYENYLKRIGVDVISRKSNKRMARAYIFNSAGDQIMYFYWGASEEMEKMDGIKSDILHIAPCHPSLAIKMAEKTKFFAFEPGQDLKKFDKESLMYIAEKADIIFCNETELKQLEKIIRLNKKEIIVTLGSKGSIIYSRKIKIPPVPAKAIDATGAGDAYKAGFWVAFMKEYDLTKCCKIGATVASFVIEKMGAQHFPQWEKVLKRYEKFFGKLKL
ncbi:MAG: carbohydrate kinase family protein [Thermoplasmata archaeon]|nr:MAG: carbohydrate kinase family protein [Thermoplasmata archaeon]